jgi:hypothetical protein
MKVGTCDYNRVENVVAVHRIIEVVCSKSLRVTQIVDDKPCNPTKIFRTPASYED